ncbi:MAG: ABC transporter ATP-binding protein [Rikenellaceae bacterium]|nr:ABC transporter ATP-binding protein [Rikenellaceae bacterium]
MESLVSLKNVSVQYDENIALESVSLDIYPDDFLGIIGPNGGGKTTLVKAILGTISHNGEVAYSPTLSEQGHRLIGYLPQQTEFDRAFPISVIEVVMSGLQAEKGLMKRYSTADRKRAMQLLEMAGIADIAERQISEISGGQMQRALLCRAVILEPKLLILDEPTNFVDNQFENELYTLLRRLNERMAIVMVSHDLGTITSVVKSIVCVNRTVHRHNSNVITAEQLENYHCPIQIISHGHVPHTVLEHHHH